MAPTNKDNPLFKVSFFGMSCSVEVWIQESADIDPTDLVRRAVDEATNDHINIDQQVFEDIKIVNCDTKEEYFYSVDEYSSTS